MEKSAAGADASLNLAGPDDVYFSFAPRANGAAGQAKAQAFTPTELGRIQPRQTLPKATAKAGHDDDDRENAYETDNSDDSDLDFDVSAAALSCGAGAGSGGGAGLGSCVCVCVCVCVCGEHARAPPRCFFGAFPPLPLCLSPPALSFLAPGI